MKTVMFRNRDCTVQKRQYDNGRPALRLVDAEDGEPIATATVNLPDLPAGPNQVFIKDYSENQGILAALEAAAIVKATGKTVRSGFVELPICELQGPYRDVVHAETVRSGRPGRCR